MSLDDWCNACLFGYCEHCWGIEDGRIDCQCPAVHEGGPLSIEGDEPPRMRP